MTNPRHISAGIVCGLAAFACAAMAPASAGAAEIFQLEASDISIAEPAPLFTTDTVTGSLLLADTVAPGASFGLADILDFSFDFAGITVTLAETLLPGGDITAIGQRSADGTFVSRLQLLFDLPTTVASCSFSCDGQIEIASFDQSNFVAIDDPDTVTLSLVTFNAALALVPEPPAIALFAAALGAMAILRRRKAAYL